MQQNFHANTKMEQNYTSFVPFYCKLLFILFRRQLFFFQKSHLRYEITTDALTPSHHAELVSASLNLFEKCWHHVSAPYSRHPALDAGSPEFHRRWNLGHEENTRIPLHTTNI